MPGGPDTNKQDVNVSGANLSGVNISGTTVNLDASVKNETNFHTKYVFQSVEAPTNDQKSYAYLPKIFHELKQRTKASNQCHYIGCEKEAQHSCTICDAPACLIHSNLSFCQDCRWANRSMAETKADMFEMVVDTETVNVPRSRDKDDVWSVEIGQSYKSGFIMVGIWVIAWICFVWHVFKVGHIRELWDNGNFTTWSGVPISCDTVSVLWDEIRTCVTDTDVDSLGSDCCSDFIEQGGNQVWTFSNTLATLAHQLIIWSAFLWLV